MPSRFQLSTPVAAPDSRPVAALRFAALAIAGSLALAVAAHVAVPFWPVPMTMQTLAVLLLGGLAGPGVAAAAVMAYMAEGLAGLPVFAHGAGLATLAGPTGGYVVGFLAATVLAARAAGRPRGLQGTLTTAAILLAADSLVFVFGVAWLAMLIGWEKAFMVGLVPFIAGEALKVALATAVLRLLRVAPVGSRRP